MALVGAFLATAITVAPSAAQAATNGAHRCAQAGSAAGFVGASLETAIAVGMAESGCNPGAVNTNAPTSGCPSGSRDRGLWQINSCAHQDVIDTCAFNTQCNADAAYRISKQGTDWWPWSVVRRDLHLSFREMARKAAYRPLRRDFTSDGPPDLLARRGDSGNLYVYPGNRSERLAASMLVGNWGAFDHIVPVGDFDRDGHADLLARRGDSGNLYLYRGNGAGRYAAGILIGDWSAFNLITGVGDWDGDGNVDLMARSRASGYLYLYRGNGVGNLSYPSVLLGTTNWNVFSHVVGAGDMNNDGHLDLLARRGDSGRLYVYRGVAGSGIGAYTLLGNFSAYNRIVGAGDWNRDGNIDIVTRRISNGALYLHRGNGNFGISSTLQFHGSNWSVFNIIS